MITFFALSGAAFLGQLNWLPAEGQLPGCGGDLLDAPPLTTAGIPSVDLEGIWERQWSCQGGPATALVTISRGDGKLRLSGLNADFVEENANWPGWTIRDLDGTWSFEVRPLSATSLQPTESETAKSWTFRRVGR
jgi:hypothetical protein